MPKVPAVRRAVCDFSGGAGYAGEPFVLYFNGAVFHMAPIWAVFVPRKQGRSFGEYDTFRGRQAFGLELQGFAQNLVGVKITKRQGFGDTVTNNNTGKQVNDLSLRIIM